MEFLVEMIRVNAFDPRIWIVLICIPLLLVRIVYVSIKRKNSWGDIWNILQINTIFIAYIWRAICVWSYYGNIKLSVCHNRWIFNGGRRDN